MVVDVTLRCHWFVMIRLVVLVSVINTCHICVIEYAYLRSHFLKLLPDVFRISLRESLRSCKNEVFRSFSPSKGLWIASDGSVAAILHPANYEVNGGHVDCFCQGHTRARSSCQVAMTRHCAKGSKKIRRRSF